jgi:hypothetical protein
MVRSPDVEIRELVRGRFEVNGGTVDLRSRSIAMAPPNHQAHLLGFALEDGLHSAVLAVAYPASQAETLCLTSHRILKGHVSHDDGSGDKEVRS